MYIPTRFSLKIAILFVNCFFVLSSNATTENSNSPIVVQQIGEEQVVLPDMENWTFNSMPTIDGSSMAELLPLSSLSALGAQEFTLGQTAGFSGVDINQLNVSEVPIIGEQTLGNLVLGDGILTEGVPYLSDFTISEISPLSESLLSNPQFETIDISQSLGQFVAENPIAANLKLNEISNLKIGSIPNLENTAIKNLPGWENANIDNIPGLSDIPLSQFPKPLSLGNISILARIDTVRGTAEGNFERTVTGSSEKGFEVPCNKEDSNTKSCSHVELDDIENLGVTVSSSFEGKAWINGQEQWVEGGSGLLKMVAVTPGAKPGLEPTGRFPFGDFAKMVLWEVDETNDSAQFVLFLRYCNAGGCTPYNIGPIPFMQYKRNAMIPIGSSKLPSHVSTLEIERKLAQKRPASKKNLSSREVTGKEVAGGISPEIMANSIISIINGGHSSITQDERSPITCINSNCGKVLGKFALHSTNPMVIESISQKKGGENFLETLRKPKYPNRSEIKKFFPPSEQSAIIHKIIAQAASQSSREIDPITNDYFCGDRLLQRTAQILAGGSHTPIDYKVSNPNTLSVEKTGQKVAIYYKTYGGSVISCT